MRYSNSSQKTIGLLAIFFVTGILSDSGWARQSHTQDISAPVPARVAARQTAKSLLESGWEKNQTNRDLTGQGFPDQSTDKGVLLAYTLNRMRHRRYRDALASATKLTISSPEVLEGWILRIWLDTLSDNYEQALAAMRSFKTELTKAKNLDDQTKNEMIKRLGRLFGYLQGPVGANVNVDMVNTTMVTVTNGFDQDQMELFNKNREAVLKQYEDLSKTHNQRISNEEAKATQINVVETQNINNQNVLIDQRVNELQPKIDALEQEAYNKLEQIRAEIAPLQREAALIDSQLNASLYTLNSMFSDYYYFRRYYRRPRHPELLYIPIQIRDQQLVVNSLRNQARSINNQIYAAEDRAIQIQNDYDNRIAGISDELEQMGYTRRKNARRLVKLAAGPTVARRKSGALSNRARALKTYDPFPLELVRQQVLEKLK